MSRSISFAVLDAGKVHHSLLISLSIAANLEATGQKSEELKYREAPRQWARELIMEGDGRRRKTPMNDGPKGVLGGSGFVLPCWV